VLSAPREPRRRGPSRGRVRLLLLVVTALALITIDFRGDGAGAPRDGVLDALGPVRSAVDWVTSPVGNAWRGITDYDELEAQNDRLRAQLDEERGESLEVAELQRRLLALEDLLDVRGTETSAGRLIARVIDAPLSNFERTVEIDRGSSDGIEVGMPVESGSGLVGRVVQVGVSRARVELVTDPSFAAHVRLVRSADTGAVEGNGISRNLTVRFVDLETVVIPGETVVTSGLDGSQFPSGIVIGTVVAARPNPVTGTQEVDVAPSADLERLSLVQVVLFTPTIIDNRTPPEDEPSEDDTPVDPDAPVQVPRPAEHDDETTDEGANAPIGQTGLPAYTSASRSTIIWVVANPSRAEMH